MSRTATHAHTSTVQCRLVTVRRLALIRYGQHYSCTQTATPVAPVPACEQSWCIVGNLTHPLAARGPTSPLWSIQQTLADSATNGCVRGWSEEAGSPWMDCPAAAGSSISGGVRTQVWYDDANSTRLKVELALQLGLGGIGVYSAEMAGVIGEADSNEAWKAVSLFAAHTAGDATDSTPKAAAVQINPKADDGAPWKQREFLISYCGGPMNSTQQQLNGRGLLYSPALWAQIKRANFTCTNNYGYVDEWELQLRTARAAQLPMMIAFNRVAPPLANVSRFPGSYARNFSAMPWPPAGDPMVLGYWLTDEPAKDLFAPWAEAAVRVVAHQPGALRWVNLLPSYATAAQTGFADYSDYVSSFAEVFSARGALDALSVDFYPTFGSPPNAQTSPAAWLANIALLRQVALKHGVPWWSFIKAMAIYGAGDREPTAAETAWQAFTSVAYGATGILHFTYNTALIDAASGEATPHYETARDLNSRLLALGPTLLKLRSTHAATLTHDGNDGAAFAGTALVNVTGSAWQELTVGEFAHTGNDSRMAVVLVNNEVGQSASPQVIFSGGGCRVVEVDQHSGKELSLGQTDWFAMVNPRVEPLATAGGGDRVFLGPGEGRVFIVDRVGHMNLKADDSEAAAYHDDQAQTQTGQGRNSTVYQSIRRNRRFAPPVITAVSPATFAVEGTDSVLVSGEALIRAGSAGAVCRINSPLSGGTTFRHGGYACGKAVEQNVNCVGEHIDFPATILNATHLRCTPPHVVIGGAGALSVSLDNGSIYTFSKPLQIRYEELVDVVVGRRPYITEDEGALLLALSPRLLGSVITVRAKCASTANTNTGLSVNLALNSYHNA